MWLDDKYFTRIINRLNCESVLWTRDGRKKLYFSNEIELKHCKLIPFGDIKVIGIASCGKTIGFKIVYNNELVEYYALHDYYLTYTQDRHFIEWLKSNGVSLFFGRIGRRMIV